MEKVVKIEMSGTYSYYVKGPGTILLSPGTIVEVPEKIAKDIKAKKVGKAADKDALTDVERQAQHDDAVVEKVDTEFQKSVDDKVAEAKKAFEESEEVYKAEITALKERNGAVEGACADMLKVIKDNNLVDQLKEKPEAKNLFQKVADLLGGK